MSVAIILLLVSIFLYNPYIISRNDTVEDFVEMIEESINEQNTNAFLKCMSSETKVNYFVYTTSIKIADVIGKEQDVIAELLEGMFGIAYSGEKVDIEIFNIEESDNASKALVSVIYIIEEDNFVTIDIPLVKASGNWYFDGELFSFFS